MESKQDPVSSKRQSRLCFGDIRCFVTNITVAVAWYSSMAMYAGSILTTQEKRYNLSSSQLGALTSVGQVGTLLTIVPVTYFGGRSNAHRPRWIGVGVLTMAVGILLGTLPHFILGPYNYEGSSSGDNATDGISMCMVDSPTSTPGQECSTEENGGSTDGTIAYAFFIAGVLVLGAGYCPLLTLGTAFVDDHAKHGTSALYLGIINMMWGVGPVVGTLLGAGCLLVYVDFNRVDMSEIDLDDSDPEWVGAWWLGLTIGVVVGFFTALPFLFIPKYLSSKNNDANKDQHHLTTPPSKKNNNKDMSEVSVKTKLKDLLKSTWGLLINPYFMLVLVAYAVDVATTYGVVPFIPKYMQLQFGLSASTANIYTACFANLPYGIGMILGGIGVKKLKLDKQGMVKFLLFAVGTGILVFAALYPLQCGDVYISGISGNKIDKTQPCNEACSCSVDVFDPVCGSDGNTYASPCHAACTHHVGNDTYTDCGCLSGDDVMTATSGMCGDIETCFYFYLFLVGMFLFALLSSLREVPAVMLAMRSIPNDQKTFGLGVRFLLIRLLGPIPIPLIYGMVIDGSCTLWRTFCDGTVKGECLDYDNEEFRRNIIALTVGLKSFSFLLYLIVLVLLKRRRSKSENEQEKLPVRSNGVESPKPSNGTPNSIATREPNDVTSSVDLSKLNGINSNQGFHDDTYL